MARGHARSNGAFLSWLFCSCVALAGCDGEHRDTPEKRPTARHPDSPEELRAGRDHTCALLSDGRVACWGDNLEHQSAGDERPTIDAPRVVAFPRAVALDCGAVETCVRTAGGELHCIGAGIAGVERVPLSSPAVGAVLHARGGCALQRDGVVQCWMRGAGRSRGQALERAAPHATGLGVHPTDPDRICALRGAQPATCFRSDVLRDAVMLESASVISHAESSARASGDAHTCEILDGSVRCSGAASYGQLGDGQRYEHAEPVEVAGVDDAVELDSEGARVCVLRRAGEVRCWGRAAIHQGPPPALDRSFTAELARRDFAPRALTTPAERVLEIRAGGVRPTCMRTGGGWWCLYPRWRRDESIGGRRPTWLDEVGAPRMRQIASGGTCGVSRDGRLICAVGMAFGTERVSLTSWIAAPHDALFAEASSVFSHEARAHVCGRTESGRVRCFRVPSGGAPNEHEAVPIVSPTIDALTDVVQLDAAVSDEGGLVCALSAAGAVHCWGDDRFGQLGPAASSREHDAFTAVRIDGLPPVVEITSGGSYACARTPAGRVWCWGSNREGAAPDGSPGESARPVSVLWPPRVE